MKCNRCPFVPSAGPEGDYDECPYWEHYGTVWKDGQDGCKLTRRQIEKNEDEYSDYLGIMGLEMGMQMDFEQLHISMDATLKHCLHMIGLDYLKHKPYKRHGKEFYKPYRNYWCGHDEGLEWFASMGLAEKEDGDKYPFYSLTRQGLDWVERRIGVVIRDVDND